MLFKILVILHTLGATIWTGGHLVLTVMLLPQTLKTRDLDLIHQFESHFEGFGLASLLLQIITGLWLTWIYFPGFQNFLALDSYLSTYIGIKVLLLLGTLILAVHARFFIIPNLTKENLNSLAYHIVGVTTLVVLFVVVGAGIRCNSSKNLGNVQRSPCLRWSHTHSIGLVSGAWDG
jgi:putative copper export protein